MPTQQPTQEERIEALEQHIKTLRLTIYVMAGLFALGLVGRLVFSEWWYAPLW